MAGLATSRITDLWAGVCSCHRTPKSTTGVLITGASTVNKENLASSRLTDIVLSSCGHVSPVILASSTVYHESLASARITDLVGGGCLSGVLITGASTAYDG
jgi:hypothetical protein